jgi:hypothetical protein
MSRELRVLLGLRFRGLGLDLGLDLGLGWSLEFRVESLELC